MCIRLVFSIAMLAATALVSLPASAETVSLRIKGGAAFAGTFESKSRSVATVGEGSESDPVEEELLVSAGGGLQFEVPVHRHAAIGAGAFITTWNTDLADDLGLARNTWIDFDVICRGTYPMLDDTLSVYLLVPVGLTVNRFSEEAMDYAGTRWGHGIGWNLSVMAGAEYRFENAGAVFLETGWTHRSFVHDSSGQLFGTPVDVELDGSTEQWTVNLGVGFDLVR